MWAATCIAALFIIAVPTATLASCADDLDALEEALFRTGNNLYQLNQNFFPPSLLPTRFVRVKYSFRDPSNNQVCNVTYIWAVGKVLFLQPPNLFKINSLFFYYPNNDLIDLPLQLPIECIHLINMTDGECTCSNDSKMLDILTQQLDIYAKFTTQDNVQRSNTFARAVCAGELYDKYYSGKDKDINYIIAAATIIGPILLFMVAIPYIIFHICLKCIEEKKTSSVLHSTKRKNLVAFIWLGIYITIYIFILDVIAANIVRTSSHEYENELSPRNISFNLGVAYFTLTFDLLAVLILFIVLILICVRNCKDIKCIQSVEDIFPYLLIPPYICIITHLGYIMLAWITQPSRSTTTLILYYFLLSYMYLMFRKTYKLGVRFKKPCSNYFLELRKRICEQIKSKNKSQERYCQSSEDTSLQAHYDLMPINHSDPVKSGASIDTQSSETAPEPANSDSAKSSTSTPPTESSGKQKGIDVCCFFFIGFLGLFFFGLAVVFIMMIYLMPLASEDLFSYLFNVIQFMIVVVSTQFAYKLVVGKEFCIKKIIKQIKDTAIKEKVHKEPSNDEGISKEIGEFVAEKLLIPQVKKNKIAYYYH